MSSAAAVSRLISLDSDACTEPDRVGAKAAQLARARRRGLPVLPGYVVPAAVGDRALRAGLGELARGSRGAAWLAVSEAELDGGLSEALVAAGEELGGELVVRSSSPLEADGRWSGAFTSYVGVSPDELAVAVRGCWASVFGREVLERCEAVGLSAERLRLAVLVQPALSPAAAGLAQRAADGSVTVTMVDGSPVGLLQGSESGRTLRVAADGQVGELGLGEGAGGDGPSAVPVGGGGRGRRGLGGEVAGGGPMAVPSGRGSRPGSGAVRAEGDQDRTVDDQGASGDVHQQAVLERARRVAQLVRRVAGKLGDDTIEWAMAGQGHDAVGGLDVQARPDRQCAAAAGRGLAGDAAATSEPGHPEQLVLLQSRRDAPREASPRLSGTANQPSARAGQHPNGGGGSAGEALAASRVASLVAWFRGPLGEELVLPWAIAVPALPRPAPVEMAAPGVLLERAVALAETLTAIAWRRSPEAGADAARRALVALCSPRPETGLRSLVGLRPVEAGRAAELLGVLDALGRQLAAGGQIPWPGAHWQLPLAELQSLPAFRPGDLGGELVGAAPEWSPLAFAPSGLAGSRRAQPDRWEPFLYATAMADGRQATGVPASAGVAAGRVHLVDEGRPPASLRARDVLVAPRPLASLAPLLWKAAAIVTLGGGPGAHLFEVARSLGVPAVAACRLDDAARTTGLLAIDGDAGVVSALPALL